MKIGSYRNFQSPRKKKKKRKMAKMPHVYLLTQTYTQVESSLKDILKISQEV